VNIRQASNRNYRHVIEDLDGLGQRLVDLIKHSLTADGIRFHNVTFRVKDEDSANRKINSNQQRYTGYESLTDVLGLRVICYFADEVDKVGEVIEREFSVDPEQSVDKRAVHDPKAFGYMSLHYIASITAARSAMSEYSKFKDTVFEIQIRSILQHAWAEIEHDLGYKVAEGIPNKHKRSFAMLASLLEMADRDFESLREAVGKYRDDAEQQATFSPDNLEIDEATLVALATADAEFRHLDAEVAGAAKLGIDTEVSGQYMSWRIRELRDMGVTEMPILRDLIRSMREHVVMYAGLWFAMDDDDHGDWQDDYEDSGLPRGIGLYYLFHVLRANRMMLDPQAVLDEESANMMHAWSTVVQELGPLQVY
jgi:putative GTP pyrophosphokinase